MTGRFQAGFGRNLEAACRTYARWRDTRIVAVACGTCGGTVEVSGRQAEAGGRHYCGPGCQLEGRNQSEHESGK